jgi:hypothetical protein
MTNAYSNAQNGLALLKVAVFEILSIYKDEGLRNVDVGKLLGIYRGHIRHEGHISRTILAIMEEDGTIRQDSETKKWYPVMPDQIAE